MAWLQYPGNSHIIYFPQPGGGAVVRDQRDGAQILASTELEVHQFAARQSSAPGFHGAGDMVKKLTDTLGMKQCAPCAQRQAALNAAMPSVWRKR